MGVTRLEDRFSMLSVRGERVHCLVRRDWSLQRAAVCVMFTNITRLLWHTNYYVNILFMNELSSKCLIHKKKFIPKCNVLSSDLYISNKWPDRFDWTRHSTWNVQSFWFLFREDVYSYWCPLLGDHLSVEDGGGPDGQVWGWWGKVWAQQAETSKIT